MGNTKLTLNLVAKTQGFNQGIKASSKALSKFGKNVSSMGKGIAVTAGNVVNAIKSIARAFGAIMTSAIDFEYQMAKVSTMLYGQMDAFQGLEDGIRQLAREYGESTTNLTNALYQILSAQVAATEALDVLRVANKLAIAGFTDTAAAAQTIVQVLKAYQLEAAQAGNVAEVLARIQWRGITTVRELTSTLGQALTNAYQAGITFEELGAAITTMTRAGLPTAEAMTAINKAMMALGGPTTRQAELFREMGIEATANGVAIKDLGDLLDKINNDTMPASNRAIKEIFGIRGQRAINAMRTAAKEFKQDLKEMRGEGEATGSMLQFMFNRMANTTTMALNRFKAQIKDVIIRSLKDALPVLKQLFNYVSAIFESIDTSGASNIVSGLIIGIGYVIKALEDLFAFGKYIIAYMQAYFQTLQLAWKHLGWKDFIATVVGGVSKGTSLLRDKVKGAAAEAGQAIREELISSKKVLWESLMSAQNRFDTFLEGGYEKFSDKHKLVLEKIRYGTKFLTARLREAKKSPKEIRMEFENLLATMAASGEAEFTIQKNRIDALKKWLSLLRKGSLEYAKVLRQLNKEQRGFFKHREKLAKEAYKGELRALKTLMISEEEMGKKKVQIIRNWIKEFKHGGFEYKAMLIDLLKAETDYFNATRDRRVDAIQSQIDLVDFANASEIEKLKTKAELEKKILDHYQAGTQKWWNQFKKLKQAELALEKHIREKKKKIFDLEHSEKMKKLRDDIEAYKKRLHMQVGNDKAFQKTRRAIAKGEAQYEKMQYNRMNKLFQKHAGMKKSEHYNNLERARVMAEETKNNLKKAGNLTAKKEKFLGKIAEKATKARKKLLAGLTEAEREEMRDKEEMVDDAQKLEMGKIQSQIEKLGKVEEKSSNVLAKIRDDVAKVMGRVGETWEETLLGMLGKAEEYVAKIKSAFEGMAGAVGGKIGDFMKAAENLPKGVPAKKDPFIAKSEAQKEFEALDKRLDEFSNVIKQNIEASAKMNKAFIEAEYGTQRYKDLDKLTAELDEEYTRLNKQRDELYERWKKMLGREDITGPSKDKQGNVTYSVTVENVNIGQIDDFLDANKAGYTIGEAILDKTRNWRNT